MDACMLVLLLLHIQILVSLTHTYQLSCNQFASSIWRLQIQTYRIVQYMQ